MTEFDGFADRRRRVVKITLASDGSMTSLEGSPRDVKAQAKELVLPVTHQACSRRLGWNVANCSCKLSVALDRLVLAYSGYDSHESAQVISLSFLPGHYASSRCSLLDPIHQISAVTHLSLCAASLLSRAKAASHVSLMFSCVVC